MVHNVSSHSVRLFAFIAICICVGCAGDTRSKVDLTKYQIKPGHAIAIGHTTEHDWDAAADVPLSRDGKAKFLWDDTGVYGQITSNVLPSNDPDEEVCVSMSFSNAPPAKGDAPHANATYHNALLAIYSTAANEIKGRLTGVRDDELSKARFVGQISPDTKSANRPWSAEFFIPWELISGADKPTGTLFVDVYRLKGERPFSLLEMKLPAK